MKIIYPSFVQIPYKILVNKRLQSLDKHIYGLILWYCKLSIKKCVASNETIAKLLKTTKQCVANSLVRLSEQKCIKSIFKDKSKKIRLEIVPLIPLNDGRKIDWNKEAKKWAKDNDEEVTDFWKDPDNVKNVAEDYVENIPF